MRTCEGFRAIKTWAFYLVHGGAQCTNLSTPVANMAQTDKPIRLTISVSPEVHSAFQRLSAASGISMGKCMGEWLADTLDVVEHTASMVERARLAPKAVMREVHAYALGLADETGAVLSSMKRGQTLEEVAAQVLLAQGGQRAAGGMPKAPAGRTRTVPPSCNTGGKVPQKKPKSQKTGHSGGGKS